MRVESCRLRNFRALKETPTVHLSQIPVIIGRNDTGKSSVIHALAVFFDERPLASSDFCTGADLQSSIEIEIGLTGLPHDVESQLRQKRLVNSTGDLVIRKTYPHSLKISSIAVHAYDFSDPDFQNL